MSTIEPAVQELYVRALIQIARADSEIDAVEGDRLDRVVGRRFPGISVADLAFERPVKPDDVVAGLGGTGEGGPYRNTAIEPAELGKMFVTDALQIVGGDGISSAEEAALLRFGPLFGMPVHEIRAAIASAR